MSGGFYTEEDVRRFREMIRPAGRYPSILDPPRHVLREDIRPDRRSFPLAEVEDDELHVL